MKMRSRIILLCALAVAGAWLLWPHGGAPSASPRHKPAASAPASVAPAPAPSQTAPVAKAAGSLSANSTNRFAFRLTNTPKTIGQLTGDRHAILLQNALIETDVKTDLAIPKQLRATGEPGAFIVQARGVIGAAFRAALTGADGQIVSYIPNNAYLVQLTSAGAAALAGNPLVQAVLPYEPYYKISATMPIGTKQKTASVTPAKNFQPPQPAQPTLLALAIKQQPLPVGTYLTLGLFRKGVAATEAQIQSLGGQIVARDRSPFGSIVRVSPPTNWIALAQLPGVQIVEPTHRRAPANDLARVTIGMSPTSISPPASDYLNSLGITGNNVIVEMNDTGVDTNHPDLSGRVLFDNPGSGYDTDGHGTHVAGIIAGNGKMSTTVAPPYYAQGSTNPAQPFQFRGKATTATIYSVGFLGNDTIFTDDSYLQETPALTNALISNNSWVNTGDYEYDLSAASYDAAVRDALPEVTGSQPVLFVFAAGNDGGGGDDGTGGNADTVASPGTAKNVITVGALEQNRGITNGYIDPTTGQFTQPWLAMTDTGTEVAGYSARGNVGVGVEGTYGRFKPDVVAPGTFVVSTRSANWAGVYDFTNTYDYIPPDPLFPYVATNYNETFELPIPIGTVGLSLQLVRNAFTTNFPFPTLEMFLSSTTQPIPGNPLTYDTSVISNKYTIPPAYLATLTTSGVLYVTVTDYTNNDPGLDFTLRETISTTNNEPYLIAESNLDYSLGPYYRYDSGTSMATPAVSGVLALMQDYFTNKLALRPSPALLKAMLINGAREDGNYGYAVNGGLNMEGWGLINLSNSLPASPIFQNSLNNIADGTTKTPLFFADQSSANTLATGDSRTYIVNVPANSQGLPLRLTLAWTDPPGNPVAAFKLVNNLELVVTNLTTGQIYYGNNFDSTTTPYTIASATNDAPVWDAVNNVQNIVIPPTLGNSYSVTIIGQSVNVNAVTTEQTNVAQDYALVIACDDANNANISVGVPTAGLVPASRVTYISGASGYYFDQFAGANAPLLSTNTVAFGAGSGYAANAAVSIGQTNQWHFYVITNTTTYTNAAFVTFIPNTMAIPREGVFAGSDFNSTLPEANLDLYVATAPDANAANLLNLDPGVIYNCISGLNGDSANLARGGTKFVIFSNAVQNQVYYVGVKCEDQMAGEYGFLGVFSLNPFSTQDTNGNVYVNGQIVTNIADGSNWQPGVGYALGLSAPLMPIQVRNVIVTNTFDTQNFGDLLGFLSYDNDGKYLYATLNNHNEMWGPGNFTLVYDDNTNSPVGGSIRSDGPGTLQSFVGTSGAGVWNLTEIDDAYSQNSSVTSFSLKLEPHQPTNTLMTVTVPPGGWYYDYVTVPVGATNLLVVATNLPPTAVPPIELAIQFGGEPTLTYNLTNVLLNSGTPPGNSISLGPPLPPGTYWVGLYNPSGTAVSVLWGYFLTFSASAETTVDYPSTGPVPLLDDAVTSDYIYVTNTDTIQGINVGLRVDHPRISDLVFTLIDPSRNRYLLMENRGGTSTNGCGATVLTSYEYLAFTEDTNLTTTPIKFAPVPFVPSTNAAGTLTNLYYQAEQSLAPLIGTSAQGRWQLEILDNRAGATNNANLVSWQLSFTFANLNLTTNPPSLPVLGNGVPQTNTVAAGGLDWYAVNVPTNADFATNLLLFATNLPVNVLFTTNFPPTTNSAAGLLINSIGGTNVLGTNPPSPNIVPGRTYYLGVQNTNASPVTYALEVNFHLVTVTNQIGTVTISSIVHTNIGGTNGFLLTWFAPTNDYFRVQWASTLVPANWTTFPLPAVIGYNLFISPTNSQFQFFDDGTQTSGFGLTRFYRLLQLQANTLALPLQTNRVANVGNAVTVTNTATDSNPAATVNYSLSVFPAGAAINPTNGIITWTAVPQGLAARFTTVAFDNGAPSASATNTFTVFVAPFPSITNVTVTATNVTLGWSAPTNDVFQVEWTTNLVPVVNWFVLPGTISSATGLFSFTDTNAPLVMKFYQLLLLP